MGFTDRDWGDTRYPLPRPHRSFELPVAAWMEPFTWVGRQALSPATAADPTLVDRVRDRLAAQLEHVAETQGCIVSAETVRWNGYVLEFSGGSMMELSAELVPRVDGEWPSIRQALWEDARDREAATEAKTDVEEKLDRLRRGAEWWTADGPPTASTAPESPFLARTDCF